MLRRAVASTRLVIVVAIVVTLLASIALILFQAFAIVNAAIEIVGTSPASPKSSKALAIGVIEAIDVFLIAIVAYIIGLGLYTLFIDETLPLPRWLKIQDFDDLKGHLVSVVIAVLAVLFLREAVSRAAEIDLLSLGVALALMILALSFFLTMRPTRSE